MPRSSRPDFPDIVQHVMQRGNNRLPCFLNDSDRADYLTLYRGSLYEPLTEDVLQEIQQQRALGSTRFQAMVQAKTQRFAGIRPPHRPRRNK